MTTPEGKIKDQVKQVLKHYDAYWHAPMQNGMGAPTLDFICCYKGQYFAVETKADEKTKPTLRQIITIGKIEAAGGKVFVIGGATGLMELTDWLVSCS